MRVVGRFCRSRALAPGRLQFKPFGRLSPFRHAGPADHSDAALKLLGFGTERAGFPFQPPDRAPPSTLPQPGRYSADQDPDDEENDDQSEQR